MAAESERLYQAAQEKHKKDEAREIHLFNEQIKTREYRDWEDWALLHTGPGPGFTSPSSRKHRTAIEAVVQQEGRTIGKHARWSLRVDPTKTLTVGQVASPAHREQEAAQRTARMPG